MAFKDMRDFLNHLEESGRLVRVQDEVALEYELAAYLRKASDMGDDGPALLFEKVKGHDFLVAGGLYANRQLMLEALETTEQDANAKYLNAIDNLKEHRLLDRGPCNEVIRLGDEADLTALPIPTYCELDGGPFITLGIAISKDPRGRRQECLHLSPSSAGQTPPGGVVTAAPSPWRTLQKSGSAG